MKRLRLRLAMQDLLWLVLVLSLALAWWADRLRIERAVDKAEQAEQDYERGRQSFVRLSFSYNRAQRVLHELKSQVSAEAGAAIDAALQQTEAERRKADAAANGR